MALASIIAMHHAMDSDLEPISDVRPAGSERSHYWHIQRKAKRGKRWIFVTDLVATKREAAEIWCKHYRGRKGFRLHYELSY